MKEDGFVTLWLGNCNSSEVLRSLLEIKYTDDGDVEPSLFEKAFAVTHFDEDFREASLVGPSKQISILLDGCSYCGEIIPKFEATVGPELGFEANAVILLYNFRVETPMILNSVGQDWSFQHVACVDYSV